MSCCVESITTSRRLTYPGAELQCRTCQALLTVDQAGAWRWQEVTFLDDAATAPHLTNNQHLRTLQGSNPTARSI